MAAKMTEPEPFRPWLRSVTTPTRNFEPPSSNLETMGCIWNRGRIGTTALGVCIKQMYPTAACFQHIGNPIKLLDWEEWSLISVGGQSPTFGPAYTSESNLIVAVCWGYMTEIRWRASDSIQEGTLEMKNWCSKLWSLWLVVRIENWKLKGLFPAHEE